MKILHPETYWQGDHLCGNLREFTKSKGSFREKIQLECGPVPNVVAALPNIGGALCATPQSLDDAHY